MLPLFTFWPSQWLLYTINRFWSRAASRFSAEEHSQQPRARRETLAVLFTDALNSVPVINPLVQVYWFNQGNQPQFIHFWLILNSDSGFSNAHDMATSEPSPVSDESSSEGYGLSLYHDYYLWLPIGLSRPHPHDVVNHTIAHDQPTAMSPRSALLAHTSLRDHSEVEPVTQLAS